MQYKVISEWGLENFNKVLATAVSEGWLPFGNFQATTNSADNFRYSILLMKN